MKTAAPDDARGAAQMAVGTTSPALRIAFDAPTEVRAALETLGRTEDVRFSPSGRRLAVACFATERIAIADVEVAVSPAGPSVAVTGLRELAGPALREPHGLDFVDEETLAVGNRSGGIAVLRLPAPGELEGLATIEPLGAGVPAAGDGPGSVLVDSPAPGRLELLACNNWADTITRHALEPGWALGPGEVIVRKWLDLPDGLALSHDRRWLAVSNHNTHTVLVYAYPPAGDDVDPVAVLRGPRYPHGIRFSADDRYLVVADAGAPHVHVFAWPAGGGQGVAYPELTIQVMDEETYARGRRNPQEGGPKGIDLDPRRNVLAVTSEFLPLAFFDVDAALEQSVGPRDEALLRYELDGLAEAAASKAAAAEGLSQLLAAREEVERLQEQLERQQGEIDRLHLERSELYATYESSRSWRLTKPLRAVTAGLRYVRSR